MMIVRPTKASRRKRARDYIAEDVTNNSSNCISSPQTELWRVDGGGDGMHRHQMGEDTIAFERCKH